MKPNNQIINEISARMGLTRPEDKFIAEKWVEICSGYGGNAVWMFERYQQGFLADESKLKKEWEGFLNGTNN